MIVILGVMIWWEYELEKYPNNVQCPKMNLKDLHID